MGEDDAATSERFGILRAQLGDRRALNGLLKDTQDWLFRYLRNLLRDHDLAEEVLQEVFVLIYRKIRWLNEPRYYRAWVYRMASREAFRQLRRKLKEPRSINDSQEFANTDAPLPETVDLQEWQERLRPLIENLPPNTRAVVILHYGEGMTLGQISAILDLPTGTVKSRLAYGLGKLRETWREKPEEVT